MAVVSCKEIGKGRGGSGDYAFIRTYTRQFQLIVNEPTDESVVVRGHVATFFAPIYSSYPSDPGAVVIGYQERQDDDDWQSWIVTVEYSSKIDIKGTFGADGGGGGTGPGGSPGEPGGQSANPLLRRAEFDFSTETYQEAVEYDFTVPPFPIRNSCREGFVPPMMIERRRLVMTIKINKKDYNPRTWADLLDIPTVNNDLFLGFFSAGKVHYCDHSCTSTTENLFTYHTLTHKFRINFQGWNPVNIIDKGFRQYLRVTDPDTGLPILAFDREIVPIVDSAGAQVNIPANLDGNGQVLGNGLDPIKLPFQMYFPTDYAVFEF